MRITLQVMDGPERGRKVYLRSGQVAQFGRTEWADFSFPRDSEMAEVHFQFACGAQGGQVRRLRPEHLLWVNDTETAEAPVSHGDTIRAGATTLLVVIDAEAAGNAAATAVGAAATVAAAPAPAVVSPFELANELEMSDEVLQIAASAKQIPEFQRKLADQQQYSAAVRVQAHLLTAREAVWWGLCCVQPVCGANLSDAERAALQAAEKWVQDPSEDPRRAAEVAAAATKYEEPGSWLASAVYWSDNLAPPGAEEVLPDPRLTGQAVTAALMIAAVHGNPLLAEQRYREFLKLGDEVATGKKRPPKLTEPGQ